MRPTPSDDQPVGDAVLRLGHLEATAVLAGRGVTLSLLAAATLTLRARVPKPVVLVTGVAAMAGHALWAGTRVWKSQRAPDRTAASSDVVACAGALAVDAASWGTRDLPPEPRWSLPLAVVISAWLPFELEPRDLSAAGFAWALAYLATTNDRSPGRVAGTVRGQWIAELFAPPACALVCRRFAVQLRHQANQLDQARADAVDQADRLAREQERNRQFRVTHDSAVQVLEAVASGWEVADDVLLARLDFEIGRLNRVLRGGGLVDGNSLLGGLTSLTDEFGLSGLSVSIDAPGPPPNCSPAIVHALCDAAHEALVNVRKHAGVKSVRIVVAHDDDEIMVSVADDGRGFDASAPLSRFGLSESVAHRMRTVGGRAEVRSTIGSGTVVRLLAPQARGEAAIEQSE